ncbi:MAG TPA: alpha/beta hydrolase [Fimbriimonadaceae bacterium]|nr:alpha/beta hydrolase [Fimbriimonadaceae bacterium]
MTLLLFIAAVSNLSRQAEYVLERDIAYGVGDRCKLDVYVPKAAKNFATVIWFHGGGLTGGQKEIPEALKNQGIAVVGAGYRLSPEVKVTNCIEDAAAATAWTIKNLPSKGADPKKIFIAGHSAGGYLASMVCLDKRWLKAHGVDPNSLAGLVSFSGQSITHFTARAERGIGETQPVIDDLAPLFHVRKDAPPILLLSGDRNLELFGRYEESAYFWRMLKEVGHTDVQIFELQGFNHGNMPQAGFPVLLRYVKERVKA